MGARSKRIQLVSQTQGESSRTRRGENRAGRGAAEDHEPEEIAGDGEEDDGIGGNYGGEDFDDDDENMEGVRSQKNQPEDELSRRANDLVRLALFSERKRMPLRRDEISKKVLGTNKRAFGQVFSKAQKILKKTFGMEMVELRSRAADESDRNLESAAPDELEEARTVAGVKRKAVAPGSKMYILRSTLDPLIIEYAAQTDEAILAEEAIDLHDDANDNNEEFGLGTYGSIISWSSADELAMLGILHVILILILVNGRVVADVDLRAAMKRLRLDPAAQVPTTAQSTHKSISIDAYLTMLMRQGYLERRAAGESKAKKGGANKRVRAAQGGEEDGTTWEWRWGHRAHSEVGEKAIADFAAEFMVASERQAVEEEEDGEGRAAAKRREKRQAEARKKFELMLKGIERGAGGKLTGTE